MLRKLFDFNKTVRHVSYKEMKARYERDRRRSELFLTIVVWVSVVGMAILGIAQLMAR